MLGRNALLNLVGHAAPLAAALVLVPMLVARLDPERFGFLAIAWVLVGYFSLFDLGLGRALTRLVAERLGTPRETTIPILARTALGLTGLLGFVVGGLLFLLAAPLCRDLLSISRPLQEEAVAAVRLLALCLPFVTLTAALRGLLEAGQRFGWVNAAFSTRATTLGCRACTSDSPTGNATMSRAACGSWRGFTPARSSAARATKCESGVLSTAISNSPTGPFPEATASSANERAPGGSRILEAPMERCCAAHSWARQRG